MDVNEYISILRLHSEYLSTLAAQLATHLAQLEQRLQEQNRDTAVEAKPQMSDLLKCSAMVLNTAEIFHQRLLAFRKKTQGDQAPVPPYNPRSSSLNDDSAE